MKLMISVSALTLYITMHNNNNGVLAFTSPIFQDVPTNQRTTPSTKKGVEIELPNFDELFGRIKQVSPLAKLAFAGNGSGKGGGFGLIEEDSTDQKWNIIESTNNKNRPVFQIDKIENFQNLNSPILRFRSSLKGPCVGKKFADFIMNLDERKKWDPQISDVYELAPIYDLSSANIAIGGEGEYGDCSRLGIGYCQTKANFAVTAREQLTLCGIQDFEDGSCLIWGTEMEDRHNHLLPPRERVTRARSHLFSTCLVPTGPDTFDVEYVLQLEIGGKIPTWLTSPILCETVKGLFKHAKKVFRSDEINSYFEEEERKDALAERNGILMTP